MNNREILFELRSMWAGLIIGIIILALLGNYSTSPEQLPAEKLKELNEVIPWIAGFCLVMSLIAPKIFKKLIPAHNMTDYKFHFILNAVFIMGIAIHGFLLVFLAKNGDGFGWLAVAMAIMAYKFPRRSEIVKSTGQDLLA